MAMRPMNAASGCAIPEAIPEQRNELPGHETG